MAPLLSEEEAVLDPYAILELGAGATEKEIRRAYRQLSLKYHPDRNPSAEAAIKLRQVFLSLEILTDVGKRQYVDTKLESDRKKREKYAELDKKRKAMVDALNAREEEAKRSKVEAVKRKQQQAEEEAIKDAGRQMLEEAQRRAAAAASAAASTKSSTASPSASTPKPGDAASSSTSNAVGGPPEITPIDLTLVLQFPSSSSSSITTSSSSLQSTLVSRYGLISHVVLKEPPEKDATAEAGGKKKKKGKGKRAIVEFGKGNWGGCWACWRDHSDTQPEGGAVSGLEDGVKAKWAGGKTPDWVEWAEKQRPAPPSANGTNADGRTGVSARGFNCVANGNTEEDVPAPSFGSAPDFGGTTMAHLLAQHSRSKESRRREEEYESMTLLRMRQMERERLAEQIRREEEDE